MENAAVTRLFCCLLLAAGAACALEIDGPEPARPGTETLPDTAPPTEVDGDGEAGPWFWFAGTSNYHNKLKTSERRVDRQINDTFGLLFPRWRRVTTFQDWRDQWLIWDFFAGVGRDINESLSWTVYVNGGQGTIRNRDRYGLLALPVETKIYFTRQSYGAGASLRWWPVGRPEKTEKGLWGSLSAVRPVMEMNAGYNHQTAVAEGRVWTPLSGDALRIRQKDSYDLLWASPRAGVEVPLSGRHSFNLLGGYLFFNNEQDDLNGIILEMFVSGRF